MEVKEDILYTLANKQIPKQIEGKPCLTKK